MTITDVTQWVAEHWGGVFGVGGMGTALLQGWRAKRVADARVQRALADALDGMRKDLEQSRSMAKEALEKASACESEREEDRRARDEERSRERAERDREKAAYEEEARRFERERREAELKAKALIEAMRREIEDMRVEFMAQHSTKAV